MVLIEIGKFSRTYKPHQTNAPQRYDYSYVLTLLEDSGLRYILLPLESAAYQIGRYRSGLYWSVPSDVFDADEITDRIWKAINNTFSDPNAE